MIKKLDFWHLASAYISTMSSPVLLSTCFSFWTFHCFLVWWIALEIWMSHYHNVFSSSQGTITGLWSFCILLLWWSVVRFWVYLHGQKVSLVIVSCCWSLLNFLLWNLSLQSLRDVLSKAWLDSASMLHFLLLCLDHFSLCQRHIFCKLFHLCSGWDYEAAGEEMHRLYVYFWHLQIHSQLSCLLQPLLHSYVEHSVWLVACGWFLGKPFFRKDLEEAVSGHAETFEL